jgi:hypothetical protein
MSSEKTAPSPEDETPVHGALLTRLPGRARPQKLVLEEFEKGVAELRQQYEPALWPLFIPNARDIFRWRIQLDCGCTHEVNTHGDDRFPDDHRYLDVMTNARLPRGEFWCTTDHDSAPKRYRDIVEWGDRKIIEFPADPEEPEHSLDAETWSLIRRTEPHSAAFWRVKLECGHYAQVSTEVSWKPDDGPKLASRKRITEMRANFEESWSAGGDDAWPAEGPQRDHLRKMLDLRRPRPEPEQDCYTCANVSRIIGYQRIGWLISRTPREPKSTPQIDRKKVSAKLAAAEAEVERLKRQLADAED